jgi:hypothetical protein
LNKSTYIDTKLSDDGSSRYFQHDAAKRSLRSKTISAQNPR